MEPEIPDDEVPFLEGFLIPVPRWDMVEHNTLYVQFSNRNLQVKFLSHPDIVPINIIHGNEDKWVYKPNSETLEGWLAKSPTDDNIALVKVPPVPIGSYFEQAYGLELPDGFSFTLYGGYNGKGRPSLTRLVQKIKALNGPGYTGLDIRWGAKMFDVDGHQVLKLGIWKAGPRERIGLPSAPKEEEKLEARKTYFNFPGIDQPGEWDKAHKFLDALVKEKEENDTKLRKPQDRVNGRPAHRDGGFDVPGARGGRHYW